LPNFKDLKAAAVKMDGVVQEACYLDTGVFLVIGTEDGTMIGPMPSELFQ
jgi:hypothetical protein